MGMELLIACVIVVACVFIHVGGLVSLAQFLLAKQARLETVFTTKRQAIMLISVFGIVLCLHMLEIAVWASFYYWRHLFNEFETALYFSLGTYATIGYGDVVLPQHWRLLGGVEGMSGVLLCGLSGAFIFAVVNMLFQMRVSQRNLRAEDGQSLSKVTVSTTRPVR